MEEANESLLRVTELIKNQGLPAFIKSAQRIAELTEHDDADMSALCEVIMKDAGMTTRLLKASNTAYNVRRGRTNTVSRAVVMLGVKEVRNICLASEVVDGLTKGKEVRSELIHELVRAFFSAFQARQIAIKNRDPHSEEVFLAALIKRLGRIIFWRVDNEFTEELARELVSSDEKPQDVEKRVLGFTLDDLSEKIAEVWELDNLVPDLHSDEEKDKRRYEQIALSNDLATASMRGWDSEHVSAVLQTMSEQFELPLQAVQAMIDRTCKEACETALSFGLEEASKALPQMVSEEMLEERREEILDEFVPFEADPMLQLACFKRLPELMLNSSDVRLTLFEVMEGMSKGLGLDRVVFALVNDDRKALAARLVTAPDYAIIMKRFKFSVIREDESFFSRVYIAARGQWFKTDDADFDKLITPKFESLFGRNEFFLAPIIVEDNFIACFYGDRAISRRPLDAFTFETFSQFALQAQIAMAQKWK